MPARRASVEAAVVIALCLGLAAAVSRAGDLRISPVALSMDEGEDAAAVWLSNIGDRPLWAQARIFLWTQRDGEEVLSPTAELTVSPPSLQVPPQGRQLIRVLRLERFPLSAEASYRLIVDELPRPDAPADTDPPLLRYSTPVFVRPGTAAEDGCLLSARLEHDGNGEPLLRIDNRGDRHARIVELSFVDTAGRRQVLAPNLAGYVLAGRYKYWPLPQPASAFRDGRFQASVNGQAEAPIPAAALSAAR
jgi:fimbrial chaperone protein